MKRSPHGYDGRPEYDPCPDRSYDLNYDRDRDYDYDYEHGHGYDYNQGYDHDRGYGYDYEYGYEYDYDIETSDRWRGDRWVVDMPEPDRRQREKQKKGRRPSSRRQSSRRHSDRRQSGRRQRGGRQRGRRKLSTPTAVLLGIVIVLAVCVLGVSVYKLLGIHSADRSRDDYWARVEGHVSGTGDGNGTDTGSADTGDPEDPVFLGEADFSDHSFQWDYDKLLQMCADAVGYIYQTGVMSYPIVQAEDNDKYLRARMDGEYDVGGTIFVDARFEDGMEEKYSIVYGHNMYNSSMFGPLPDYEEKDYYKKHPYFDIYIGYKHYRYYVFSAFVADAQGYVYTYELEEGRYKEQFDRLRVDGLYETDVRELREDDHVIVLSTCVDFHDYDYRNVVCLVRGEEVIDEEGL